MRHLRFLWEIIKAIAWLFSPWVNRHRTPVWQYQENVLTGARRAKRISIEGFHAVDWNWINEKRKR